MYAYVAWKEGKFVGACLIEPKSERVKDWLHEMRKRTGVTISAYATECDYLVAVGLACPAVPRPIRVDALAAAVQEAIADPYVAMAAEGRLGTAPKKRVRSKAERLTIALKAAKKPKGKVISG
jgi:hypothetical protein